MFITAIATCIPQFKLGNIRRRRQMRWGEQNRAVRRRQTAFNGAGCHRCQWKFACYGCPKHRFYPLRQAPTNHNYHTYCGLSSFSRIPRRLR
ncbi:SPASM domain-containing protein [Salmonella enterica subsp. enterica]|nr:SPASM domain-containing protein [Salmonella enterica subsp. enterica]